MSKKLYVVWVGRKPGIYETWEDCKAQVDGYKGAKFKSFKKLEDAANAFKFGPEYVGGVIVTTDKEVYIEDKPEEDLPGWKPNSSYPKEAQTILEKIKENGQGNS